MFFYEETSQSELAEALFSCGGPPQACKLLHTIEKKDVNKIKNSSSGLTDLPSL